MTFLINLDFGNRLLHLHVNPRRAGAPKLPWSAAGGRLDALSHSAPGRRSEKRKKTVKSSSKIISKLYQCIFR